ncbi:hypothetical protein ACWKWK_03130 [Pseudoxanthomonas beigongshangi]
MRQALALPVAIFNCSAVAAVLLGALTWWMERQISEPEVKIWITLLVSFFVCLSYVMIVGLPIGRFLIRKRMFRAVPALVAGAIAACPIPLLVIASSLSGPFSYEGIGFAVAFLLFTALSGAISGLVFYRTHRLMSPDGPGSGDERQMAK